MIQQKRKRSVTVSKRKHYPIVRLSAVNPLDWARLFAWLSYAPRRLQRHIRTHGDHAHYATGGALAACLTWTPLVVLATALYARVAAVPPNDDLACYVLPNTVREAILVAGYPLPLLVIPTAIALTVYAQFMDRHTLAEWKERGAGGLLFGGIVILMGVAALAASLVLTVILVTTAADVLAWQVHGLLLPLGGLALVGSGVVAAVVAFTVAGITSGMVAFTATGLLPANLALVSYRSAEAALEYGAANAYTRALLPLWVASNLVIAALGVGLPLAYVEVACPLF